MSDSLTQRLGRFAAELAYDDLPPEIQDKTQALLLHGLAVGLTSSDLAPPRLARAVVAAAEPLATGARILMSGERVTAGGAIYANAALLHARNADDTYHTATHVGCAVIPVALAVAETAVASGRPVSGRDVLAAISAGYEVSCRCTGELYNWSTRAGFRSTSIYDPFGAAATAGRLLGLDPVQMSDALGLAASGACGLLQGLGESKLDWKLQPSQAARAGYLAAVLAQAGVTGPRLALEGPAGFYRAFCGVDDPPDVTANLGHHWELLSVASKLFPVAMYNQTPLRAVLQLRREHGVDPAHVDRVDVEMAEFEVRFPGATFAGPFEPGVPPPSSIPHVVATGLARGDGTLASLSATDDPTMLSLVPRVTVTGSATRPMSTCRIVITLQDGRSVSGEVNDGTAYYYFDWQRAVAATRELQVESPLDFEPLHAAVEQLDRAPSVAAIVTACLRS